MKKLFILITLSGIILLNSCTSHSNALPSVKVFDKATSGNIEQIPLDDICTSIEKITIKDVPDNVFLLLETPHNYYISFQNSIVYQYDKAGNLIQKIGDNGRGPGEYLFPRSFNFLPDSLLFVFDYYTQKIMKYSTSGKHLSDKEVMDYDFLLSNSVEKDGKVYFFTNGNYTNIEYAEYDPATNEFKKMAEKNRTMVEGECLIGGIEIFGREPLYMYNIFNDTLFVFNNNNFEGKLLMNIDGLRYSFSELASIENMASVSTPRIQFNWMNASDSYLFIDYGVERKSYLGLYNFKTGEYFQNVEITSADPAAVINNQSTLFTGYKHGELIKVYYPENEDGIQLIKYRMK